MVIINPPVNIKDNAEVVSEVKMLLHMDNIGFVISVDQF